MSAGEAVRFLTVVRGHRRAQHNQPGSGALGWFPVVGGVLGAALGVTWWALLRGFPAIVAAIIVVALDLGLTGMLHFDGLLDAADGLLPVMERERRLVVMKEPDVGAFAVATGGVVLLARVAALASIRPGTWWAATLLLAGLFMISRSVMVVASSRMRYARPIGLASSFLSEHGGGVAAPTVAGVAGIALGTAAVCAWRLGPGVAAVSCGLAGAAGVLLLAGRRLGGFTGDVLGAAGLVSETLGLLVAAARW